jgi:hypothetical protein
MAGKRKSFAKSTVDERLKNRLSPTFKDVGEAFVAKGKPYKERTGMDKSSGPSFRDLYDMATEGSKAPYLDRGYKKGGSVKSSASRRGDGIAIKGKTKGKMR